MKAVLMADYGGPDVLRLGEVPVPTPTGAQFLIKVAAIGVNPADGKWRSGMFAPFAPLTFPHILGYDVAGTIVSGPGAVGPFAPGTRIAAALDPMRAGGYAEYALATAAQAAPVPHGMALTQAAAVPTPGLTGAQLIEEFLDVQADDLVLITGATGAVGRFALHAALTRGARVVAAVRQAHQAEAVRLGATATIALGAGTWSRAPFDKVADTVGGVDVAALCRHVPAHGRIRTVATTPIPTEGLAATPISVALHPDSALLARLLAWVADGALALPLADTLPLADAARAQRRLRAGSVGGKIVLIP